MARRYGRNQRRTHREEIARLQAELDFARFGAWERASGRYPELPLHTTVERDVRDIKNRRGVTRKADVDVFIEDPSRVAEIERQGWVEWDGFLWYVRGISVLREEEFGSTSAVFGRQVFNFELEAVGRRDITQAWLETHDRQRYFH